MINVRFMGLKFLLFCLIGLISGTTEVFAGTISGRVTDQRSGQGLKGVAIKVYNPGWTWIYRTYTDSGGNYTTQNLRAGKYFLQTVNASGFIDVYYDNEPMAGNEPPKEAKAVLVPTDANVAGIHFKLTRGASVSGRVFREKDGSAVSKVAVSIYNPDGKILNRVLTDKDGRYTIASVAGGKYYLKTLNDQGYIDEFYPAKVSRQDRIGLISLQTGSQRRNIDIGLIKGGSISGRIISGTSGKEVPYDLVKVYDSDGKLIRSVKTDPTGRYIFKGLAKGGYYVRSESTQNYLDIYFKDALEKADAKLIQVSQDQNSSDINFTVTPGGAIAGRINRKDDGNGIRNVFISVFDNHWNYVKGAENDIKSNYYIGKLPAGNYFVQTSNNQDLLDIYFKDTTKKSEATPVSVKVGAITPHIDFSLQHKGAD